MAANKYLADVTGVTTEIQASDTSAGAGDAGKIVALNSAGYLDISLFPPGIGGEVVTITASEALSAGDFVNIHNSSGVKVRKADATSSSKAAHGYVIAAVSNGAPAQVYLNGAGNNTALSGMTIGARYYLSNTTPGAVIASPTYTTGQIRQYLGVAISATELDVDIDDMVIKA